MVNKTIEIWSLDLAGIKEIMVFQCTAKLVESLASPATSFATKQAERCLAMEQIQKWFWGGGRGLSPSCWKWVLNSVQTSLPLEAKCPTLRSDLPSSFNWHLRFSILFHRTITHITVTENCWCSTVHPLPSASKRMSKLFERKMSQILQTPHHTKEITLHDFTLTYSSSWNLNCRTWHPNCPAQACRAFGHAVCFVLFFWDVPSPKPHQYCLQLEPS